MASEKLSLKKALLWIVVSVCITTSLAWMTWIYASYLKAQRVYDPNYHVVAVVQSSKHKEGLKTAYLAEWLHLSIDQPVNLYQFDIKQAEQRLRECPLIQTASIQKIRPGILYIDYTMRIPIAYVGDYTNTAIDKDGYLFPFSPFFTPKNLPTIYLGIEIGDVVWGTCLKADKRLDIAFDLWQQMKTLPIQLKTIDVSQVFAESCGQRQIVVIGENKISLNEPHLSYIIRLHPHHFYNQLADIHELINYLDHSHQKVVKPIVLDFRIPHLAFIQRTS